MIVRLLFRAAAVAALVWVARELMRRWVEGPDRPAVEGNWQSWETPAGRGSPATTGHGDARHQGAAPAPTEVSDPAAPSAPAAPPEGRPAAAPGTAGAKKAPSQKAPSRRAGAAPGGSWVDPNGSGEPPATHPVKAKTSSRVYRVPGMAMYDRTIPDRCYTTPEAAEADGFTRAKR